MRQYLRVASLAVLVSASACGRFAVEVNYGGPGAPPTAPGPIDLGDGTVPLPELPPANTKPPVDSAPMKTIALDQTASVYQNKNNILEPVSNLGKDSEILLPENYQYVTWNFRTQDGAVKRSSTGFVGPLKVKSVAGGSVTAGQIEAMNQIAGGLYISASVVNRLQGIDGDFPAIHGAEASAGFLTYFESSGRPRDSFHRQIFARFGAKLNAGVEMSTLSSFEQTKWRRIFRELQAAADRKVPTPKSIIMTTIEAATQASIDYEKTGKIALNGAWTIATEATAVRHGFANAPCAETMSEFIRQAYTRAGYEVTQDFNTKKGNYLIWNKTAAVIGLRDALASAGWVPWDAHDYRPPIGAIVMNEWGQTPGHTYIAAGDDGRLIVDNGAPQGRDLRVTKGEILGNQFHTGLFFLPPGINPEKW